jgi:hypothetical protein
MNTYTMSHTLEVAKKASLILEEFLKRKKETIAVINVENHELFRKKDIDLIWLYHHKGSVYTKFIEIKADRYSHTGNYFIETVSNQQKAFLLFYRHSRTKHYPCQRSKKMVFRK